MTGDAPRDARSASARLERLRSLRPGPSAPDSLGALFREASAELGRAQRRLAGVADAWASVIPEPLASRTALQGLSRGVLTVIAADSAARFEVDRLLRSGAEAQIIRRSKAPVRRVKISLAGGDEPMQQAPR